MTVSEIQKLIKRAERGEVKLDIYITKLGTQILPKKESAEQIRRRKQGQSTKNIKIHYKPIPQAKITIRPKKTTVKIKQPKQKKVRHTIWKGYKYKSLDPSIGSRRINQFTNYLKDFYGDKISQERLQDIRNIMSKLDEKDIWGILTGMGGLSELYYDSQLGIGDYNDFYSALDPNYIYQEFIKESSEMLFNNNEDISNLSSEGIAIYNKAISQYIL